MSLALRHAVDVMRQDPSRRVSTWTQAWYQDAAMKITGNTLYIRELLECTPASIEIVLQLLERTPGMAVCVCSEHFGHECMLNVARLIALERPSITLVHKLADGRRMQATYAAWQGSDAIMWHAM